MYTKEGQEMMDWSTSTMIGRSMGIDVAWGDTSKFAIVITQYRNSKVEIFYAESFDKPLMNEIINHIMQLKQRHHCTVLRGWGQSRSHSRTKAQDRRIYRVPRTSQKNRYGLSVIAAGRSSQLTFKRDIKICFSGHIR